MALPSQKQFTLQDFENFNQLPENRNKNFEFINGEIIEVPSNPYVSVIASRLIGFLLIYLLKSDVGGHVTGEGGGFVINGHVFAPDVAYIQKLPTHKGYETTPPLLAVEVISDPHSNTEQSDLRRKMLHYMQAGVIVWVVDYLAEQVEVHIPEISVTLFSVDDILTIESVLPGFKLKVKDIFPSDDKE